MFCFGVNKSYIKDTLNILINVYLIIREIQLYSSPPSPGFCADLVLSYFSKLAAHMSEYAYEWRGTEEKRRRVEQYDTFSSENT